jgi:hypothetical protein
MEDEKNRLLETDALIIIEYIKTSIEILLSLKGEERGGGPNQSFKKMLPSHLHEDHNSRDVLKRAGEISWNSEVVSDDDGPANPSSLYSNSTSKASAP